MALVARARSLSHQNCDGLRGALQMVCRWGAPSAFPLQRTFSGCHQLQQEEKSRPEAGIGPLSCRDKLIMRGMLFYGHHGVYEEERKLGQKFHVDVDAWVDLRKAGETDQLQHSVSYAELYRHIKSIMEGPPHLLLESVATAIATAVLKHHPKISDVRVRVGKPNVAVQGVVDMLGVEIFRRSSQLID